MDRLEAMSMLVAVIEKGSFSAAARGLGVPLTTLSRKIADLEARVGARLLLRTTRKLTPTDEGVAYVAAARRILEQVDVAEREAAGELTTPKGELVLTAPLFFGRLHVLPVVAEFLAGFPAIDVRLVLSDRHVDLVGDHVDMAVRIGKLPDSSLAMTAIGGTRTVTCASPALLARHATPREPSDLASLPCIAVDAPMPTPAWRYRHPESGRAVDASVTPRLRVTTPEAAAHAAILDVGVARLLHYQVAAAVRDRALRLVLERYEPEPVPVQLVHAARGRMPLKMRAFLDFAAPRLRAHLAEHLPEASRRVSRSKRA